MDTVAGQGCCGRKGRNRITTFPTWTQKRKALNNFSIKGKTSLPILQKKKGSTLHTIRNATKWTEEEKGLRNYLETEIKQRNVCIFFLLQVDRRGPAQIICSPVDKGEVLYKGRFHLAGVSVLRREVQRIASWYLEEINHAQFIKHQHL